MKRITINKQTRKYAMCAMDNMDIYLNSEDPFMRVPAYSKLKNSISSISAITGIDYETLYETLLATDLSNYNLLWLRRLIAKQIAEKTGKRCCGIYFVKQEQDWI